MGGQKAQQNSLAGTVQGSGGGSGSGGGGGGLAGFASGGNSSDVFSDPQTYAQLLQIMAMMA